MVDYQNPLQSFMIRLDVGGSPQEYAQIDLTCLNEFN
jgi:hypothetical protein